MGKGTKDTVIIIALGVVILSVGLYQYRKHTRLFAGRYLHSQARISLLQEVDGLYIGNTCILQPDFTTGEVVIEFTTVDNDSRKKLVDVISESYLEDQITFVIKSKDSNDEVLLTQ